MTAVWGFIFRFSQSNLNQHTLLLMITLPLFFKVFIARFVISLPYIDMKHSDEPSPVCHDAASDRIVTGTH